MLPCHRIPGIRSRKLYFDWKDLIKNHFHLELEGLHLNAINKNRLFRLCDINSSSMRYFVGGYGKLNPVLDKTIKLFGSPSSRTDPNRGRAQAGIGDLELVQLHVNLKLASLCMSGLGLR